MYVKVFAQILDSSIAEDHLTRWVFEDLLKLADREGIVDMTLGAIARRTNVPIEVVVRGVEKLTEPDLTSRSMEQDGRRIVLIDPQRPWGWRIVNYLHYRNIRDSEERKAYFREAKANQRKSKNVQDKEGQSEKIQNVTQAEEEAIRHKQREGVARRKRASGPSPRTSRGSIKPEQKLAREVLDRQSVPGTKGVEELAAQVIRFTARSRNCKLEDAAIVLENCIAAYRPFENIDNFWFQGDHWRQMCLGERK